jgi:hypothetical protein
MVKGVIGAPSIGQCEREALPRLLFCSDHADRDVMAMLIHDLHSELCKVNEGLNSFMDEMDEMRKEMEENGH